MKARYAAEPVEELAARLGPLQKTGRQRVSGRMLLRRLAYVKRSLDAALARLARGAARDRDTAASEWLLDNVHLLAGAYERVREGLPPSFYRQLPRLARPRWRGEARVYAIARALVEDGRGQFDPELTRRFLRAYAPPMPLAIGELWALPAMLRLVLLEGLAAGAEALAGLEDPAARAVRRLWREPPASAPPDRIGSYVESLRAIDALDWTLFVESVSEVERLLAADPTGVYARMDAPTRDRYRKSVERLARACGVSEEAVVRTALTLAHLAADDTRREHVGFYLMDAGRDRLLAALHGRGPGVLRRVARRYRVWSYLGAISGLTLLAWLALAAPVLSVFGGWDVALVALLGIVPASAVGVAVVNWLVSHIVSPKLLPRLDYTDGVPEGHRTAVVVPALLTETSDVDELLRQLELNYQGNPDPNIAFVLLADGPDAPTRELPTDAALIAQAEAGIRRLNQRYGSAGTKPFWLFTRERSWNAAQGCWMGWERKRGKLREFNALVLGRANGLVRRIAPAEVAGHFRYALVLDADTFLPQGAAARLIGTLAHPLNRAVLAESGEVRAGYTVLQPRVEILPGATGQTPFATIMEADRGLDLYSGAVSDVYQDLFDEGNFAGKGLLDIAAFERTLEGRVPENSLLSHDLFEGVHGRAALVSDVVLYEDFPGHVLSYMRRLHRWVRGDWQIAPWLLPRVPGEHGWRRNRLSLLDRWKILDNLRRSLYAASLVALLLAGWTVLPGSPWRWLAAAVLLVATPVLLGAATEGRAWIHARRRGEVALSPPVLGRTSAARIGLALLLLPFQAGVELDAAVRTLGRLLVTRRDLLVWHAAAQTARAVRTQGHPSAIWRAMAVAPTVGIAGLVLLVMAQPAALPAAALLLVPWLLSPAAAARLSRPAERRRRASRADVRLIRAIARRTWGYFEQFAGPEDHWLPPDNFQEGGPGVAHRTSPTNAGLLALSALSAYDLGYVPVTGLTATTGNLLDTLDTLERYRGHFLNWYDTRTLEPLQPRYVSTVDSGNLAASLLALAVGCEDAVRQPLVRRAAALGLADALTVLRDQLRRIRRVNPTAIDPLLVELAGLAEAARATSGQAAWAALLGDVSRRALPRLGGVIVEVVETGKRAIPDRVVAELRTWVDLLAAQTDAQQREAELLLPWLYLPPPAMVASGRGAWPQQWRRAVAEAERASLATAPARGRRLLELLELLKREAGDGAAAVWAEAMRERIELAREVAARVTDELEISAARARILTDVMDFRFLYDSARHLFRIGYDASAGRPDGNYYDLLASEARLASLVAMSKREAPGAHWLHLSRPFALRQGRAVLLSWGGSMFEYLLPTLLTRTPDRSLLGLGCRSAIAAQMDFARSGRVPWGMSECAYAETDAGGTFQYRAFGVPALALRAHPADRLVVSAYASLLAAGWVPADAARNLRDLCAQGMLGTFGLYEAMDFGPVATGDVHHPALVRSYMAHHQGMILAAAANLVTGQAHVHRFHRSPGISALTYLLYETVPRRVRPEPLAPPRPAAPRRAPRREVMSWRIPRGGTIPEALVLSNGELSSLLTERGDGGLAFGTTALTRRDGDPTIERHGPWLYLQDQDSGALWAATSSPGTTPPEDYDVVFAPDVAEFHRREEGISSRLAVAVAADGAVELRRLTLANETRARRRLRVSSYGEVVLAPATDDLRHRAFSKLFVESEFRPDSSALLFRRRSARENDIAPVLAHGALAEGARFAGFATDRARFLGRDGGVAWPAALVGAEPLGGDPQGATLDPVFALAYELTLRPGESTELVYLTAVGRSQRDALMALEGYRTRTRVQRAFAGARERAERELARWGVRPSDMPALQALLSAIVYPFTGHPLSGREPPRPGAVARQRALWALGISGDLPVVLLRVPAELAGRSVIELVVRAHAYWRHNGVRADLLLLDENSGYSPPLNDWLHSLLAETGGASWLNAAGGVFHIAAGRLDAAAHAAVEGGATIVLDAAGASLLEQLRARRAPVPRLPGFVPIPSAPPTAEPTPPVERARGLLFDNGLGGFTPDGSEYVIHLAPGASTPAPWINVVANPELGFTISEAGAGFTWCGHSGEHRLTPWTNDPVVDAPGEALYLRDEETAEVWSPTPRPAPAPAPYEVRHTAGCTRFRHASHGLEQEVTYSVAPADSVRIVRVSLANTWARQRRITLTCYLQWVLGPRPDITAADVMTAFAPDPGAILAWQVLTEEVTPRVAFLTASLPVHGATGDRAEFLGTPGNLSLPAGLERIGLAGTFGGGLDPCGALQVHVDLAPGAATTLYFAMGEGAGSAGALELARAYRDPRRAEDALRATLSFWDTLLGRVQVRTPEPSLDLLLNRWLPYQVLSCRVWGRSALYQSSGAFGFRDQLQDTMALLLSAPELARAHLLQAAARQFAEGDVLHWWHPHSGRGLRSRCSDDLLWLPYVAAAYVEATGDYALLDESVPFLAGEPLAPAEMERYRDYSHGPELASLYDHCLRALARGVSAGPHGLPLMGGGDWNDGMNLVGARGTGESVWLAWFLHAVLTRFAPLCRRRGDEPSAQRLLADAERMRSAAEGAGWDGAWYRRAYFDDGSPLGTASAREARIDSIPQSWAALSGAAQPERARSALAAVEHELICEQDALILLLAPPFDRAVPSPGYIRAYPPGVRENGGQYTHAAVWAAWAFAALGDADRAGRLLRLLDPVRRSADPEGMARYAVEPYVVAGDIGGAPPYTGRGGWTWYTGSAAWLYRFALEGILGLGARGDRLIVEPRLPTDWPGYDATVRLADGRALTVHVERRDGDIVVRVEPAGSDRQGDAVAIAQCGVPGRPSP